jgi:PleD family two-component response regulator
MSVMMVHSGSFGGGRGSAPSILLVSDSQDRGRKVGRALEDAGFRVQIAGDYSRVEDAMDERQFDMMLLEVSTEAAVEPAVEAALRVKRAHPAQFVGYLADASLSSSGLGGDGIFPRNTSKLPAMLRSRLASEGWGES